MVILIQCMDRVGLVAKIAGVMADDNVNIVSMREHVDTITNRFFARLATQQHPDPVQLLQKLKAVLPINAIVDVNPDPEKKIIILVTKEQHCLSDMLVRHHFKTLGASIRCVIGNYPALEDICKRFQVPFVHVSHEDITKDVFESRLLEVISRYPHDYLVLAKFMRILSPAFVEKFPMRLVNIHHSFLPAFTGANPYRQAHLRGVKLIGATAHFVTNDLDEGPIIAQQIIPVDHTYTAADMIRAGKEIEKSVLNLALTLIVEDRVFVYDNKTVVFA